MVGLGSVVVLVLGLGLGLGLDWERGWVEHLHVFLYSLFFFYILYWLFI